jgi:hypothetical protein
LELVRIADNRFGQWRYQEIAEISAAPATPVDLAKTEQLWITLDVPAGVVQAGVRARRCHAPGDLGAGIGVAGKIGAAASASANEWVNPSDRVDRGGLDLGKRAGSQDG